jgi:hypothetical protein
MIGAWKHRHVTEYRKFKLCQPVHIDEYKAPADAAKIKGLLDSGFEYVAEISEELSTAGKRQ